MMRRLVTVNVVELKERIPDVPRDQQGWVEGSRRRVQGRGSPGGGNGEIGDRAQERKSRGYRGLGMGGPWDWDQAMSHGELKPDGTGHREPGLEGKAREHGTLGRNGENRGWAGRRRNTGDWNRRLNTRVRNQQRNTGNGTPGTGAGDGTTGTGRDGDRTRGTGTGGGSEATEGTAGTCGTEAAAGTVVGCNGGKTNGG
ncbi:hypothetical protein EYF80_051681 [Liparis tanakae]|uniref:Uncharacterized protein n=1 Tax=Liparis tanakae TaxID=230148 RepID=A0A4Z2FBJ9_9TELE|nr:hypothetical protein EYF80_051681 [Liparis tanakae]